MSTKSLRRSFGYALCGIATTLRSGRNARIQLAIAVAVVVLAFFLRVSRGEWAVLIVTIGLVLAAEAINTAIEGVVDLLSPEHHARAKVAKDVAAGAVLVAAIAAAIVGLLILGPPLYEWLIQSPPAVQ